MKILNVSPYWVVPPNSGGSIRIYNLNKEISNYHKISQISFRPRMGSENNIFKNNEKIINQNYHEIQKSFKSILASSYILYKLNLPYDLLQSFFLKFSNFYMDNNHDLVQIEHPWLFDFFKKKNGCKPIILDSHNVEFVLIKDLILKNAPHLKFLLPKIYEIERSALERSDLIFCVSKKDIDIFHDEFKIKKEKMKLIPNGVSCEKYEIQSENEKKYFKEKLGLPPEKIVLFIGSDHYPNREAISYIRKYANENKKINFLVLGSVGKGLKSKENLIFTGHVKDLMPYIKSSDIAINPLASGSGTNLKMLEYLAAGLPTITTKVGNRGLDLKNSKEVIVSDLDEFTINIKKLIDDDNIYNKLRYNGREKAEKVYDWPVIANTAVEYYEEILN